MFIDILYTSYILNGMFKKLKSDRQLLHRALGFVQITYNRPLRLTKTQPFLLSSHSPSISLSIFAKTWNMDCYCPYLSKR